MKYILHFKDGHDQVVENRFERHNRDFETMLDNMYQVESWETWYPEWQGNERGDVENEVKANAVVE